MSKPYKQHPPYAIQIEPVEGCNLACSFCGINGIREGDTSSKPFKMMNVGHAEQLAVGLAATGWNPRVEFAMHGEPTMHPQLRDIVWLFRKHNPKLQLMVTTNGAGLIKEPVARVAALFEAGLNVLAIDKYEHATYINRVLTPIYDAAAAGSLPMPLPYPENPKGNPHTRRPVTAQVISVVEDISDATKGTHSSLNNHAGCAAPPDHSQQGKRCAKPFRELSVRYDGNVAVCCNDWRGTYYVGNVIIDTFEEVWWSAAMHAARVKLYHGQRDFGPCDGCNAKSYRVGLLPDKYGKDALPEPDKEDRETIEEALGYEPLAAPVLREWEK